MSNTNTFISVAEIMTVLSVSESKAYSIVRSLNAELKQKQQKKMHFVICIRRFCRFYRK